ncbi:cytidine deaminase-like protein [Cercophora newfieldiana]|uniref:Deoxycytidylate deaminase n=1 Tax=Cercophora newfieldiana TaxID=92897 RepID=A0AA39XTG0_9PEZI|nr:cytidine deaminase-like protein [Cercophora newfieldiana]
MFIGVCGSAYAGKETVADYLVKQFGFTRLTLDETPSNSDTSTPSSSTPLSASPPPSDPDSDSSPSPHHFTSALTLLDYVTTRWRSRFVTTHIPTTPILDLYSRRPFFLLLSVDAPLLTRYHRFLTSPHPHPHKTYRGLPTPPCPLETFTSFSDDDLFDSAHGQLPLMSRATVRILNTSSDVTALYATLDKLNLLNPDRLRPSWDAYFMSLASLAAQRSNCMKRRVGCVVVRDRRVISTGYNGTPRGLLNCGEGGCGRCNAGQGSGEGLATCLCLHAEENALLEAGRERLREGAVLYCDTCPCLTCSIKIVQVGISEVVYSQEYSMDSMTATVLREGGVRLRQFVPPENGLIRLEKPEEYN